MGGRDRSPSMGGRDLAGSPTLSFPAKREATDRPCASAEMVHAVASGDHGKVYKLFREGSSPHAIDPNGDTLLSRALQNGHAMTALIIVKAGADPTDDGVPKTDDQKSGGGRNTFKGISGLSDLTGKLSAGRAGLMKVIVQQGSKTVVKRSGYNLELLLRCFEHAENENAGKQLVVDALSRSNNPVLLALILARAFETYAIKQPAKATVLRAHSALCTRVAVGLVEHMSLKETIVALQHKDPEHNRMTPMDVALAGNNYEFVRQPHCQNFLHFLWTNVGGKDDSGSFDSEDATIMDKTREALSLLQRVLLKPRQFFLSPLGFHATEKMAYLTLLSVHMYVCAHTNAGPGAQSEGADSRTPVAEYTLMTLVLSFLIYEFQERSRAGSAQYWSFWWNKVDVVLFSLLITREVGVRARSLSSSASWMP